MKFEEVPMFYLFRIKDNQVYGQVYQKCPEGNWRVRNLHAGYIWMRFGEPVNFPSDTEVKEFWTPSQFTSAHLFPLSYRS